MKIALSRLSVGNLATLASRIIDASEHPEYSVVHNHVLVLSLKKVYADYFEVFGKKAYSGMGQQLVQANRLRTANYSALRSVVKGYKNVEGFSARAEARDLYSLFTLKGSDVFSDTYISKSGFMFKLVQELEKPENQPKIEKLHLQELVGLFKSAVEGFEECFYAQNSANAELRLQQSATSMRKELEQALANYLALAEAMKAEPVWDELHALLNEHVKAIRNSQRTRKSSGEEPEELRPE